MKLLSFIAVTLVFVCNSFAQSSFGASVGLMQLRGESLPYLSSHIGLGISEKSDFVFGLTLIPRVEEDFNFNGMLRSKKSAGISAFDAGVQLRFPSPKSFKFMSILGLGVLKEDAYFEFYLNSSIEPGIALSKNVIASFPFRLNYVIWNGELFYSSGVMIKFLIDKDSE